LAGTGREISGDREGDWQLGKIVVVTGFVCVRPSSSSNTIGREGD